MSFLKSIRVFIQYFGFLSKSIHYLSFSRVLNFFRLIVSYKISWLGLYKHSKLVPFFISVEPSNSCQLSCPECPVGQRDKYQSEKKQMDFQAFRQLIDELSDKLMHVIFYFQGEPLLNRQLPDFIQYAHKARLFTSTSTNAQLLTDEMAKKFVLSGLDKLIISVDGSSQEVYEKYRVGGSLKKTLDGVKYVVEWKRKLKSLTPFVEVQCLVLKSNEHQLDEIKKLVREIGADKMSFKSAQLYDFENGHELMTSIERLSRYRMGVDGKYFLKNKLPNRCWRLWSGAVVTASGEVVPCCFDKELQHSFGSIEEKTFSACWYSNKASGFRKSILQNRKQFDICRNCTGK